MPKLADLLNSVVDNPKAGRSARNTAPKVKPLTLDDITPEKLPVGTNERIVYMALYAASVIGHREGYADRNGEQKHTHVVQGFVVSRELKDAGYLEDLGERPYDVLLRLTTAGFVKQAGNRGWIPTCFDVPYTRGARSQRGGRSSELRRIIDSMLVDVDEQGTGTEG